MNNISDQDKINRFWNNIENGRIMLLVYLGFSLLSEVLILGTLVTIFENIPTLLVFVFFICIALPFGFMSYYKIRNIKCPYCNNKSGAALFVGFIPPFIYCKSCGTRIGRKNYELR